MLHWTSPPAHVASTALHRHLGAHLRTRMRLLPLEGTLFVRRLSCHGGPTFDTESAHINQMIDAHLGGCGQADVRVRSSKRAPLQDRCQIVI